MQERLPTILTRAVDSLHREWKHYKTSADVSLNDKDEDAKSAISELSKLRYLMMTNKPLEPLTATDALDYAEWHKALSSEEFTWFQSDWLFVECYMYRKIADIFLKTKLFRNYDPFETLKRETLNQNMQSISAIAEFNINNQSDNARLWLELSLWGNRCDLSLKNVTPSFSNLIEELKLLRENVIVNQSQEVLDRIKSLESAEDVVIDVVLDNSGFELFTDLCLMNYLTSRLSHLHKIRIHVKSYPWFVSDVMKKDFLWTIDFLISHSNDPNVVCIGKEWKSFLENGRWQLVEDYYWTYPYDYDQMARVNLHLFKELSASSLIIFKGDLNYRKLLGDLNWNSKTSFSEALRSFKPRPSFVCALRTNKADLIVGFEPKKLTQVKLPHDYLVSGEYAVIQVWDGSKDQLITS